MTAPEFTKDLHGRAIVTAIETYSGKFLDYLDPRPEDIDLVDVARGLAFECRYGRQVTTFYSVAEHAMYVADLVREYEGSRELEFAALHHDSAEAYMGDLTKPMKWALDSTLVTKITDDIDRAIGEAFGLDPELFHLPLIEHLDKAVALRREAATLKWSHGIGPHWGFDEALAPIPGIGMLPGDAEREFLARHKELAP